MAVKGIAPPDASIGAEPERLQRIGSAVAEELGAFLDGPTLSTYLPGGKLSKMWLIIRAPFLANHATNG